MEARTQTRLALSEQPRLRTKVRGLVEFYVAEHNGRIPPHTEFQGQTPDEMYFGSGEHVPDTLAVARSNARQARIAENRTRHCGVCR